MNSTLNNSEDIKREEGQKQLLEKSLQAHRNEKWIINFTCTISLLLYEERLKKSQSNIDLLFFINGC